VLFQVYLGAMMENFDGPVKMANSNKEHLKFEFGCSKIELGAVRAMQGDQAQH
jgi:hypothetical protein